MERPKAAESKTDISVVICTLDRHGSLAETLAGLAAADRSGLAVEVVTVDNGNEPATRRIVESFSRQLHTRYLVEPQRGICGKSHALNRALDAGGLGRLVVVLDDDMSVEPGWWQGIAALSARWPDADFFSGPIRPIWPPTPIPEWAKHPRLRGWIFSARDVGTRDLPLQDGQWFSGNFFWFRSRVLETPRRFPDTWFTEAQFQLQLIEEGAGGVSGPDAVVGHRIQPQLLEPGVALRRAVAAGAGFAGARLSPCRHSVRNARWASAHPLVARIYCLGAWLAWSWRCWRLKAAEPPAARFADRLLALERRANYREALRLLFSEEAYRLFARANHRPRR